ncbi:UPF0280 family protein [Desulfonatronovibrio magnus]|uniref:UPF0280 family protein n=1 Tax=Desulfonatronovibrio magnus TaxID=698827 RepID=UPI0005EAFF7D|nr:UPF0280 family protein [Desulfonatronovibrio magnus]
MKYINPSRNYRQSCTPFQGEVGYQLVVEQSDLYIISTADYSGHLLSRLHKIRQSIKTHILFHPEFAAAMTPLPIPRHAPTIIQNMCKAAALFNVGPMAAVAGAVAQDIAQYLNQLSPEALIENGGDIFIYSTQDRLVGLLADPGQELTLGIRVKTCETPCAVCSSSATIGHSISLGKGDLVVVKAKSGAVADAAATALCNMVNSRKSLHIMNKKRQELEEKGVTGLLAQLGEELTAWGEMELVML